MRFTIRRKLIGGFGLLILLMLVSSSVAYLRMSHATTLQYEVKEVRYPATTSIAVIEGQVADASGALRGYVLFGIDPNDAAKFKTQRAQAWSRAQTALQQLQSLAPRLDTAEEKER